MCKKGSDEKSWSLPKSETQDLHLANSSSNSFRIIPHSSFHDKSTQLQITKLITGTNALTQN